MTIDEIDCPTCGKKNTWKPDNQYRPFCCKRCKIIDLGDWAAEKHRVPGDQSDQNTSSSNQED